MYSTPLATVGEESVFGTGADHTGLQVAWPQPAARNTYSVPIPLSTEPADETNTRPPATAGVVCTPLLSCAVHSGEQLSLPHPVAGQATRKPESVPTYATLSTTAGDESEMASKSSLPGPTAT